MEMILFGAIEKDWGLETQQRVLVWLLHIAQTVISCNKGDELLTKLCCHDFRHLLQYSPAHQRGYCILESKGFSIQSLSDDA